MRDIPVLTPLVSSMIGHPLENFPLLDIPKKFKFLPLLNELKQHCYPLPTKSPPLIRFTLQKILCNIV